MAQHSIEPNHRSRRASEIGGRSSGDAGFSVTPDSPELVPPTRALLLGIEDRSFIARHNEHGIYALLNRIRICASDAVLSEAERVLASITEQYFSPNLSVDQLHGLVRDGARSDPLRSFAEACRAEVRTLQTAW